MIKFWEISGLEFALRAAGLPKAESWSDTEPKSDRAKKLAFASKGSGHDTFLKGITLHAVIDAPQYWWMQMMRYSFVDIVSSQSKMHQIEHMDILENCNDQVDQTASDLAEWKVHEGAHTQTIVSNVPMGLKLTAGITTNYLQLKTIYSQRRNHKLPEWHEFCDFIKHDLPLSYLIVGEEGGDN